MSVPPASYLKNSEKEERCLKERVYPFHERFKEVFSSRRDLLLTPKNEHGVPKFVCTTLRPTLLDHGAYQLNEIAQLVADMMVVEPLSNPLRTPDTLQSPRKALHTQTGHIFDSAHVLCSLLLGAGFDAYVVFGYAPQWICMQDTSFESYPGDESRPESQQSSDDDSSEESESSKKSQENKDKPTYKLAHRFDFHSKLEISLERKRVKQEKEERLRREAMMRSVPLERPKDSLSGKRVHAWVCVRESVSVREQDETVFVEPTTGHIYRVQESPYLNIEAMWNHLNYYVLTSILNQDPLRQDEDLFSDLQDTTRWHRMFAYVLFMPSYFICIHAHPNSSHTHRYAKTKSSRSSGRQNSGTRALSGIMMPGRSGSMITGDIPSFEDPRPPPSWVLPLTILPSQLLNSPFGPNSTKKTTVYRDAKLERYANHPFGLKQRLTRFEDPHSRLVPVSVCVGESLFSLSLSLSLAHTCKYLPHQPTNQTHTHTDT